jgi:branched-chain amino acid transport system substrate-binding protein
MRTRGSARPPRPSGARLTRRDLVAATLGGAVAFAGRRGWPFEMPAVLAASSAPVKVGVLLPYSKVYQQLGEDITSAMVLYFESVGFKAGGRAIVLIREDEEIDPQVALRKGRKLIERDNVDLIAGLVASPSALALRDVVHNTKTLLVIANAGANAVTRARRSPYIFRASFSNWQTCYPIGKWFYDNVARSCLVGASDYAAGHEDIDGFKQSYLAAGGKVVGEVFPPLNNTDYGPYIAQMQKAKPEALFVFFAGSDAARFVTQGAQFGLFKDARLAGPGFLVEEDVLPAQGRHSLGAYSCLHWALTLQTPENLAFTRAYRERWKRDATVYAMQGYDTARVIVDALNAVGGDTTNKPKLIEAMASVRFTSPRGPISFDPETHNVVQTLYVRQVREVGKAIHNVAFNTLGVFKDPGA